MKHLFSFLFIAFLSTTLIAQTTWKADPAHTQVTFEITHLGIADIKGGFDKFDGNIVSKSEDFSDAQYEITIDVPSINTGIEMRDNHLRSADFFDAEKHPEMTFKSTSSEKVGENKYKVTGNLTFHGITKPVSLEVLYRGSIEHPQNKKMISGFAITGQVKRSDFNLGPNFPEPMLSDTVVIDVNGEFIKQ
ncbi:polyisoprenoid-binding protein [Antarcticibacterium arcticum]|uniref:Polyisoprenoid-binding protein n=1 Tax=Antarcticibacterium arcticum TaxID=2585771 RepID=A0A5B8YIU8_9FLAO|nr:YceI family protein [Antarcticibacterium arcticum]QED37704.1 polyisoprenoid-binding protein [Antarcticibacterium arcticum]